MRTDRGWRSAQPAAGARLVTTSLCGRIECVLIVENLFVLFTQSYVFLKIGAWFHLPLASPLTR
jgi:hypothetical protein